MTAQLEPEIIRSDLSTTALLRALAVEVSDVGGSCRALETIVSEVFSSTPQGHLLNQLQAFDLIIQRIAGAAAVIDAMAEHVPHSWLPIDQILGDVSLADLALRLSGQVSQKALPLAGDAEFW